MINALLLTLFFYVGFGLFLYVAQRNFLYVPDRNGGTLAAIGAQPVNVKTVDGLLLRGWYIAPAPGQPVAVYFHGNAGNVYARGYAAKPFVGQGVGILYAEYRGFGGNPGFPSQDGLYNDAQAYIDWLAANGVGPERMIFYGESLGTGVAIHMAAKYNPVYAVILESAYSSMVAVAQAQYPIYPAALMLKDKFDNLSVFGKITVPVLMIHGGQDEVVPYAQAEQLKAAAGDNVRLVRLEGSAHNTLYYFGAPQVITDFIKEIKGHRP